MRLQPKLVAALCLPLLLLISEGAEADPIAESAGVATVDNFTAVGHSSLNIAPTTAHTGFVYCVIGSVPTIAGRVAGGWTVRVTGVRDGIPYTQPDSTGGGASYSNGCPTISTSGTDDGYFVFDVSYAALGGSTLAHSVGIATWTIADGYHATSVDLTP